ncbi:MAG: DUF2752 domain-containing protein [Terriglobales bacterium]
MASGAFTSLASAVWRRSGERAAAPDCYRLLFNPFATWGSLAMLLLVAHLPPDGAGIPVCLFRALSGLPCPGCGLTRALSSLIQGHPAAALSYHPFAFIVLPLFLMLAVHNFLPLAARQRVQVFCGEHDRLIRRGYHGFIYTFVAFGVLRTLAWSLRT